MSHPLRSPESHDLERALAAETGSMGKRGAFGRPDTRPEPPLHRGYAYSIARRSHELTFAGKVLYGRMLELDRTAAGVFEKFENLAADVGLGVDSCRKIRKELLDLGLLYVHKVKTATGVREFWYCRMPVPIDMQPSLKREIPAWIASRSQMLDQELRRKKAAAKLAVDSGEISRAPRPNSPSPPALTPESQMSSSTLDSQSETVIRDCEVQTEKGVQHHEAKAEAEKPKPDRTQLDPQTRELMEKLERKRAQIRSEQQQPDNRRDGQ